ncbi:MAG: RNA polymerase sigma factor RpoD/SigA [Treponemataceae bacterium]|nr:RNA polymerase sigma factor RpoD/SigA [Treponemataceae bacterium]
MKEMSEAFKIYSSEIEKYSTLTAEEEKELFSKMAEGNKLARDKIFKANLRYVLMIANRYQNAGLDYDDLVNEGNIGLLTAVDKFDLSKNCRFTTYANYWILQSIQRAIQNSARCVKLPANRKDLLKNEKFIAGSLDCAYDEFGEGNSLSDSLSDERYISPEEEYLRTEEKEEVKDMLKVLNSREKYVIKRRFGLGNSETMTLSELGSSIDVSREGVRRIEARAIMKMHRAYSLMSAC